MTYVGLTKAFDTVSRDGLWNIMAKFGCLAGYIAMGRQSHDDILARVQNGEQYSEPFPITNAVKHGCTATSMVQHEVLCHAYRRFSGMLWRLFNQLGKLFNIRSLQAKSKVQTDVLYERLYASDMTKNAATERTIQEDMDRVSQAYDN